MPSAYDRYRDKFRVPQCDDPVFQAWCQACDLVMGRSYDRDDPRIAKMEQLMYLQRQIDSYEDNDEYYLTPFLR